MTTTRAWKSAVPRAADDTLAVQASVLRVEENREVRDGLADLVAEHALLVLLEGPEERFGIAVVSPPILSGLIEATTTGRIASRPVIPRSPTRTDATIIADLLDAVLERFETNLVEMEEAPNIGGYRFAAPIVDARSISLTLSDGPYSVYRMTLDLGGGVRQGEIAVAFPIAARGDAGRDVAAFQEALAENVMSSPSELDAVLHRLQLPLSQITGLQVGDVLRVPLSALKGVDVAAYGGARVAQARLGQQGGFRAVRITCVKGEAMDAPASLEFHEAAPAPQRSEIETHGEEGEAAMDDFPGMADLPEIDEAPESESAALPDLEGLSASDPPDDLPDLSSESEGDDSLPEIPGLPPLSG